MKIRVVRFQTVLIKYILAESFALAFLVVPLVGAKLNPNERRRYRFCASY